MGRGGVPCPKPETPLKLERRQRRLHRESASEAIKRQVKARDGWACRWPHCEYASATSLLEAAHIKASGMGGDPTLQRMTPENLIAICDLHHRRAPQNLHNGGLRIEPLTRDGANGPCSFQRWDPERREYVVVAEEIEPRILARD